MNSISKMLIVSGIILVATGLIFQFSSKIAWLGRLPGDIYVKKDNFSFYFPITTSLIISAIITILLYILGRR